MLIKLPFKLELKNLCDLVKECFGIEDNQPTETILPLHEICVEQPKQLKKKLSDQPIKNPIMIDASTNTNYNNNMNKILNCKENIDSQNNDFVLV